MPSLVFAIIVTLTPLHTLIAGEDYHYLRLSPTPRLTLFDYAT